MNRPDSTGIIRIIHGFAAAGARRGLGRLHRRGHRARRATGCGLARAGARDPRSGAASIPTLRRRRSEPVVSRALDSDGDGVQLRHRVRPAGEGPVGQLRTGALAGLSAGAASMKPGTQQLWRVLNASAITYLDLALIYDRAPQKLGLVGIDGVPCNLAAARRRRCTGSIISAFRRVPRRIHRRGTGRRRAAPSGDAHGRHRARAGRTIPIARWSRSCHSLTRANHRRPCRRMPHRCRRRHGPGWETSRRYACENWSFRSSWRTRTIPIVPASSSSRWTGHSKGVRSDSDTADIVVSKVTSKTGSSRTARWNCMISTSTSSTSNCASGPEWRSTNLSCAIP